MLSCPRCNTLGSPREPQTTPLSGPCLAPLSFMWLACFTDLFVWECAAQLHLTLTTHQVAYIGLALAFGAPCLPQQVSLTLSLKAMCEGLFHFFGGSGLGGSHPRGLFLFSCRFHRLQGPKKDPTLALLGKHLRLVADDQFFLGD